jgi:hypothetical protein
MEGAQILADLDAALRIPGPLGLARCVLGFVSSPHGLNCAVVFKGIEALCRGGSAMHPNTDLVRM